MITLKEISLEKLEPDKNQPRLTFSKDRINELAKSLKTVGLVEPIMVRQTNNTHYQIILGERRYRAAVKANFKSLICLILDVDDKKAAEIQAIESYHHVEHSPIEKGRFWSNYRKRFNTSKTQLAKMEGVSVITITRYESLCDDLNGELQTEIMEGKLNYPVAYEIARIKNKAKQKEIAEVFKEERVITKNEASLIVTKLKKKPQKAVKEVVIEELYGVKLSKNQRTKKEKEEETPTDIVNEACSLTERLSYSLERIKLNGVSKISIGLLISVLVELYVNIEKIINKAKGGELNG